MLEYLKVSVVFVIIMEDEMKRHITVKLEKWKDDTRHKPLFMAGAV